MRWWVIALVVSGCAKSASVTCSDGRTCPAGTICAGSACATSAELAACNGLDESADCIHPDGPMGTCITGVCVQPVCGDGIVSGPELCEPGLPVATNDCRQLGFYEPGEVTCNAFCRLDTGACVGECGDDIVNGDELCEATIPFDAGCVEFGFDVGRVGCTAHCGPSFSGCGQMRWVTEEEVPTTLRAVWGPRRDLAFAVGDGGAIYRFDGTRWTPMVSPVTAALRAVHGSSDTNVWAVGGTGVVLHYDGTSWSTVAGAAADPLYSVWVVSPTEVYIGGQNTMYLYDGTFSSLRVFADDEVTIWGLAPGDLFVSAGSLIWRRVGTTFQFQADPGQPIRGLWGSSLADMRAAGGPGATWIFKRDSGGIFGPELTEANGAAQGLFGLTAHDIYAPTVTGRVMHFDGAIWAALNPGQGRALYDVWAADSRTVWAVGEERILRLDGVVRERLTASGGATVEAIWGTDPHDLWLAQADGQILRFNGKAFTGSSNGLASAFRGIWGDGAGAVYAVGPNVIATYTGSWSSTVMNGTDFRDVTGVSPTQQYAVAAAGVILSGNDTTTWTPMTSGVAVDLNGVWAANAANVFAVGNGGTILHNAGGATWTAMTSTTTQSLRAVWGTSATDVWAAGHGGTLLHFDGTAWSSVPSGTVSDLFSISGSASDDIFAGGEAGFVLHWDGSRWSPVATGSADGIQAIWAGPRFIYLAGDVGTVHRIVRNVPWTCRATETGCADDVDNDCDGLLDANDPDCP